MEGMSFDRRYFEDQDFPPGLKGGDEVRGYGYYPDYFPTVQAQLSALVELTAAETMADLGCGKGALAAYARRDLGVHVTGVDLSGYAVAHAARGLGAGWTVRAGITALPLADASCDAVWCNGVLQYLEAPEARAGLAEIARVTRGAAFVSNIAAVHARGEWGRQDHLTQLYLPPGMWARLAPAGAITVPLPFEGESAVLLLGPAHTARGGAFALRFMDLALARLRRLGALERTPPTLAAFRRRYGR